MAARSVPFAQLEAVFLDAWNTLLCWDSPRLLDPRAGGSELRRARAAGLHAVLLDPFDDWSEADCERARDVAEVSRRILASRVAA